MTNTVSQSSTGTGLMYPKTKSDPAWALWAETLAPYEAILDDRRAHQRQTCLDTFSQWSQDANLNGFSAKMFVTLMQWSSTRHWSCADTEALLSRWIAPRLRVREGLVSSWQDSIQKAPPKDSRLWLPHSLIKTLIRCAWRNKKPLLVLLRDAEARLVYTRISFMKDQGGAYVASHTMSGSLFKDSLLDGLTEYLTRLANEPPETQSQSPSPSGSENG